MTESDKKKIARLSKWYGRNFAINAVKGMYDVSETRALAIVRKCEDITPGMVRNTADKIIESGAIC